MKLLIVIVLSLFLLGSITFRTILFNIHLCAFYAPIDFIRYLKKREWTKWNGFGIRMFTGYFGSGKSMLASKYIVDCYKKYKDSERPVKIISNIPLSVPYEQLQNISQITDTEENTIIFIDECNTLFNSRNWKDFPVELVYQLCQNRKKRIMMIMTAPRFHLVDKAIRDVVQYVYNCNKMLWRIHAVCIYDGWDMENAINVNYIRPLGRYGVFAKDSYYKNYDSFAIIDNVKKEEFLSKREIVENRGVLYNPDLNRRKSKKYKSTH